MRQRARLTFDQFAGRLILLVAIVVACVMPAQDDTYWQLRAGRDIWRGHAVPTVDRWSFTATGRAWPDHEWLWQALAYPLDHVGGMPLLVAVNVVIALAGLIVARSLAPDAGRVSLVVLLVAVPLVGTEWSVRPQVASLLMFALTMRAVARERWRWIPPLFLVWANLHAAVSAGGVLLGAVSVWALVRHLRERDNSSAHRLLAVVATTAASALATLVNPMGWHLWAYVWNSRSDPAYRWIAEWQSAWHLTAVAVVCWCLVLAVVGSIAVRRNRFATWQAQMCAVTAIAAVPLVALAVRNLAFLALAAVPTLTLAWQTSRRERDAVPAGRPLLALAAGITALLVAGLWVQPVARLNWKPISPAAVAAVDACPGRIFNTYDEGGYLLWFAPGTKVFIDSRLDPYPTAFLRQAMFTHGPSRDLALMERYAIRCAVLPPSSGRVAELAAAGWTTTYADDTWVVLRKPI